MERETQLAMVEYFKGWLDDLCLAIGLFDAPAGTATGRRAAAGPVRPGGGHEGDDICHLLRFAQTPHGETIADIRRIRLGVLLP